MKTTYLKTFCALVLFGLISVSCNNSNEPEIIPPRKLETGQIELKTLSLWSGNSFFSIIAEKVTVDWGNGIIDESVAPTAHTPFRPNLHIFHHRFESQTEAQTILISTEKMSQFEYPPQAAELRFGNFPNLYQLDISTTGLTVLEIEKAEGLHILNVRGNRLQKLDLSGCPTLHYLYGNNNELTSIDVSKNPELRVLELGNSKLTSLDVSKNPRLQNVLVHNNQFTASALNALFESLPNVRENGGVWGWIFINGNPGTDDADRSIATNKWWEF
jgi:Leucine-rich repeat (LRR) protein